MTYQSDALPWNLSQIEKVGEIGQKALGSYEEISKRLRVEMHSGNRPKKIQQLLRREMGLIPSLGKSILRLPF